MPLSVLLLAREARAERAACAQALSMPSPSDFALDACLRRRPFLTGSLGLGLFAPGGGSAFLRGDLTLLDPLWGSARYRHATNLGMLDLMAGFVFRSAYGRGRIGWMSLRGEEKHRRYDPTTGREVEVTTQHYGTDAYLGIARYKWVLAAGLKQVVLFPTDAMTGERSFERGSLVAQAGLQSHRATHFGTHETIEIYGLWNWETSTPGFSLLWHNSIPAVPWLVFGMDLGLVPAEEIPFYWAIVDLGFGFEL